MNNQIPRRDLMKLAGATSIGALLPGLFASGLGADEKPDKGKPAAPVGSMDWSRVLVLVELRGGNDGLNTVVPFTNPAYYKARPRLAVPADKVLKLDKEVGLNPVLDALMPAWTDGDLGVIQGVGYANPNRSHFRGIDIWNGGSKHDELTADGWVARILNGAKSNAPSDQLADGIVLGYDNTVGHGGFGPLFGHGLRNIIMNTPQEYINRARKVPKAATAAGPSSLQHLLSVQDDINQTAETMAQLQSKGGKFKAAFPGTHLGRHLEITAKLLSAGAKVPVWKMTVGGFDTHAGQAGSHPNLIKQVGDAIAAFRAAMIEAGMWDKVLVATYSEFGRRVEENGSAGTDHGTAAPHFVLGGKVKGGILSAHPSMDQLDGGDLIATTDYRSMYAGIAQDWWGYKLPFLSDKKVKPLSFIKTA